MHIDMKQIQRGWEVIDAAGEKIGDVQEARSDYVLVTKGLIFLKDLYIPADAIEKTNSSSRTIVLNVQKSAIDETEWSRAPIGQARHGQFADRDRDDAVLTVKEERVRAEKDRKKTGEVEVGKRVVNQQVDMEVPVTSEEVSVSRRRVDRAAHPNETFAEDDATIRVPVTAEEVHVAKEPRVVEEVVVSKRPVTEKRHVSDTVRREEVVVDETGDARLRSDAASQRRDAYARGNTDDDTAGTAGGAAAGAVGGAAVGAAVGGPPGAVVGGAVGAAGGAVAGDAVEDEVEADDRR